MVGHAERFDYVFTTLVGGSLVRCQKDTPAETFLWWLCKSAFPVKAKPSRSFQTFNHMYIYIYGAIYIVTICT